LDWGCTLICTLAAAWAVTKKLPPFSDPSLSKNHTEVGPARGENGGSPGGAALAASPAPRLRGCQWWNSAMHRPQVLVPVPTA